MLLKLTKGDIKEMIIWEICYLVTVINNKIWLVHNKTRQFLGVCEYIHVYPLYV